MFDELDRMREEAIADSVDSTWFSYTPRGGRWTMNHTGVIVDSWRAYTKPGAGLDFVTEFKLKTTATFATNLYGEHGAIVMARWWCALHDFVVSIWSLKCDDTAFSFQSVMHEFEEPAEVAELHAALEKPAARHRIDQMRTLVPKRKR